MVSLSTADRVLKSLYLDVITEQLNNQTNPFYNMIEKGSENICGKDAVAVCKHGINGGVGSSSEIGLLPTAGENNYLSLKADLKNIYGTLEISDKVLRASKSSAGSLVNVLNNEMEGLLDAAKFNFGRMLFQNGDGALCVIGNMSGHTSKTIVPVSDTKNLMEGMRIDLHSGTVVKGSNLRITLVDRQLKTITISPALDAEPTAGDLITMQLSRNMEIFGLPYIFNKTIPSFYGLIRSQSAFLMPTDKVLAGDFTTDVIQSMLDGIEERSGNNINLILTSYDTRRKYISQMQSTRINIDYMNLDGGFKALSYNGIPMYTDRFCDDGSMYFINTKDFKLVQLNDWEWIQSDTGNVLRQLENKAAYSATLVKYANLICTNPTGLARLSGITA